MKHIYSIDSRRELAVPGNKEEAIAFATRHFIALANQSIEKNDRFTVALSGGSTPKAIFEKLTHPPFSKEINWKKVWLFWSDERSVPSDHNDSNYHLAMEAGFKDLPIPKEQIFRMKADEDIQKAADEYDKLIEEHLGPSLFDLVMLGMGEDGHTASLFPNTEALNVKGRAAVANYVSQKDTWRMTLTFECINNSEHIVFYAIGANKKEMLKKVLFPEGSLEFPSQLVGTERTKALWIADMDAAGDLIQEP